ncbi:integrating conjugative element membrane protein, partial [Vibrio parahaemolyticus]
MKRWFTFSSVLIGTQAQASIPTNNDPTQGGSDNILELIYNYAYDILLYGGGMFI